MRAKTIQEIKNRAFKEGQRQSLTVQLISKTSTETKDMLLSYCI